LIRKIIASISIAAAAATVAGVIITATPATAVPPGTLRNCFDRLAECGYPRQTSTGVPSAINLTQYTGPVNITVPGTVINGKKTGCLVINAPNVVIRNSRISGPCEFAIEVQTGSLLIQDSEIDCVDGNGTGLIYANYIARRVHVHDCANGFHVGGGTTVEDSYIKVNGGNGIESNSGTEILIRHNTFASLNPLQAALNLDHSNLGSTVVQDNFFSAGEYSVICPQGVNASFLNNRFYATGSNSRKPVKGFSTGCTHPGFTWTGNFRDDNRAEVVAA
jgi:Right handed beta helix region